MGTLAWDNPDRWGIDAYTIGRWARKRIDALGKEPQDAEIEARIQGLVNCWAKQADIALKWAAFERQIELDLGGRKARSTITKEERELIAPAVKA